MQGTTKHCYMLNTQALALVVLEKNIFFPLRISLLQILTLPGHGQFGPWGTVGRIYGGDYIVTYTI